MEKQEQEEQEQKQEEQKDHTGGDPLASLRRTAQSASCSSSSER